MILYFSRLRGKPISDADGVREGKLDDIIVRDGEKVAEVTQLVVKDATHRFKIPIEAVQSFADIIYLNAKHADVQRSALEGNEIMLREAILDRQLIDINGLKVVRVNDILLVDVHGRLSVISVDAGMHGFMRRLGLPGLMGNKEANLIPWEYVEPIHTSSPLRLKIPRQRIASLHPADLADLLEELSPKQRASVFKRLDDDVAADTLAQIEPEGIKSVIAEVKEKKIASVLERMAPDEAADVLSMLQSVKSGEIIRLLNRDFAHKVQDILGYEQQSAGRIMNPDFIAVKAESTAQEVIDHLRKIAPNAEQMYYLYVIDAEGKLVGVLSMRQLLITPPESKVADFMRQSVIKVSDKATKDEAARLIVKFNLSILPVVDERDVLVGIIAAENVLTGVIPKTWRHIRPKRSYYLRRKRRSGRAT